MSVIIRTVEAGSPCDLAGVQPGGGLVSINSHEILDVLDIPLYHSGLSAKPLAFDLYYFAAVIMSASGAKTVRSFIFAAMGTFYKGGSRHSPYVGTSFITPCL